MLKKVRLNHHAYEAFNEIERGKLVVRAEKLRILEPGFGLLLLWCQIEMMLKLIRYYDKIKDGWPDKLCFINAKWSPLSRIKGINKGSYENILGSKSSSLWKYRNRIAHTGKTIEKAQADKYWKDAMFVLERISEHLPTRESVLTKKRRSDAQLNRKKCN